MRSAVPDDPAVRRGVAAERLGIIPDSPVPGSAFRADPFAPAAVRGLPYPVPMALIVHKYGGTSMGSTERIRNVAKRVAQVAPRRPPDRRRALGDVRRNQPPARARQGAAPAKPRRRARARHDRLHRRAGLGRPAGASRCRPKASKPCSYAGWQVPITTDSAYTKARIRAIDDAARARATSPPARWWSSPASRASTRTATSRRWAAAARDTSAVARRRGAEGRRVPDLHRRRRRLHDRSAHRARGAPPADASRFEEMLEMASLGSKVLQIRSVEFAGKYQVPLRVLSSFTPWDIASTRKPTRAR